MNAEKITDMWVFNELISKNYINAAFESINDHVRVWVERSSVNAIDELLANASKKKSGNAGRPEFIIYDESANLVIVIEDKKDPNKHVFNKDIEDRVDQFAVNGALWYSRFLKDRFNVIAIAISGTDTLTRRIDTFGWKLGVDTFTNFNVHEVLRPDEYRELLVEPSAISRVDNQARLLASANAVNAFMHHDMNVIEHNRLYILGAILFALEDPVFKSAYSQYNSNDQLASVLWNTLERRIKGSKVSGKETLIDEMRPRILTLAAKDKIGIKDKYAKGTLHRLISDVDRLLYEHYQDSELDLISLFFSVFLSYSTKGGSDLGIVLTPSHIARMFTDLAEVSVESKVLDPCAGTGGFLTAAWRRIALDKNLTATEKDTFRRNNLFGVEVEPSTYAIVALNMFLNKDGQSHLTNADCFSITRELAAYECNVGFINPPYSDATYSEISFVELMLDSLLPGSIGVAIVPVNAVSSRTKKHADNNTYKQRILAKNQLLASIEMPKNLFYPKGTETIVLVFRTGEKHSQPTWMAKFDDEFELLKHQKTRTPTASSDGAYAKFLQAYQKRADTDFSFHVTVDYTDQWVYTLFDNSDYELADADLQITVSSYIANLFSNQYL